MRGFREALNEAASSLRTVANIRAHCSPAKAGVQGRDALQFLPTEPDTLLRSVLGPGLRRGTAMKPMSVLPAAIMLIAIVLLIIYLRPH